MSSFSRDNFGTKLTEMTNTQQSIQTLSFWLIHHRKHAVIIVDYWLAELLKAPSNRKLLFLFLANDVLQNSRKKGAEFVDAFAPRLKDAFIEVQAAAGDKIRRESSRLLEIWEERQVFTASLLDDVRRSTKIPIPDRRSKARRLTSLPPRALSPGDEPPRRRSTGTRRPTLVESFKKELDADAVENEPEVPPPTEVQLMAVLAQLRDDAASQDETTRQLLADLRPEISDASLIAASATDKDTGHKLEVEVDAACDLVTAYNQRLDAEFETRKGLSVSLRSFTNFHTDLLRVNGELLAEYESRLQNATKVRERLQQHLKSLPDMSRLPKPENLAPLPPTMDLFLKPKSR